MKKIIGLVHSYFREHFSLSYFISVLIFTSVVIYINYAFDFEQQFITEEINSSLRLLKYFLWYAFSFGGAYLLYLFSRKDRSLLKSFRLWLMILAAAFLFAFRWWFFQYRDLIRETVPWEYQRFAGKCVVNLSGFVWLFIPCSVYWFFADRKRQPLYGFHIKGVVLRPYLLLLLFMVPLILAAATQKDFLETYPRYFQLSLPDEGLKKHVYELIYEICYSLDFVVTEFFFRGFLILGFARFAGPKVILPMCVFYVVIHFGKPLGETISSFFGGWLLGILAYETKSIYGGIIVHLGIALLMEAVASGAHIF